MDYTYEDISKMIYHSILNPMLTVLLSAVLLAVSVLNPSEAIAVEREVVSGIKTKRPIPGEPYDLLGKRIVFTNWYYVQPGDLDWVNAEGVSVYVRGDEDLFAARHVGINAPRGIRLMAQKPHIMGPLFLPHRCIIQDGEIYRGWTNNEYYESKDAIHWEKKANLKLDKETDGIAQVFIDPTAPPAERFKAVWSDEITVEEFEDFRKKRPDGWEPRALLHYKDTGVIASVRGSVSPDGITWTTLPDPLVVEMSDTTITAYYDTVLRKYVMYTRYWSAGPRTDRLAPDIRNSWTGVGRRAIGRSETDDFRRFPPSEMILEPPPHILPSEVLYTNCRTTVPGAPDHHLMFPAIWNASIDDTTRIGMASSHNGINWHWVPGGDLLETQPFGQWDGGCIWAGPSELIELPNGDWALPYSGHNVPHKYPRGQRTGANGYAVWPKGRMVALEAADRGEFTLIPVMPPGRTLKINALTKRTGSILVEVGGGTAGEPLEIGRHRLGGAPGRSFKDCTPIVGDQFWTTVTWKGEDDLGFQEGQSITLRFKLDKAKIFGLEFE